MLNKNPLHFNLRRLINTLGLMEKNFEVREITHPWCDMTHSSCDVTHPCCSRRLRCGLGTGPTRSTNVIPKLNFVNRLLISKLLMSINTEIRGPSPRCRCLPISTLALSTTVRKETFVHFVCPTEIPQSPFAWKY